MRIATLPYAEVTEDGRHCDHTCPELDDDTYTCLRFAPRGAEIEVRRGVLPCVRLIRSAYGPVRCAACFEEEERGDGGRMKTSSTRCPRSCALWSKKILLDDERLRRWLARWATGETADDGDDGSTLALVPMKEIVLAIHGKEPQAVRRRGAS